MLLAKNVNRQMIQGERNRKGKDGVLGVCEREKAGGGGAMCTHDSS